MSDSDHATVTIKLTPRQRKELEPLFGKVAEAAKQSALGRDRRGALLGQVWGNGEYRDGEAIFFWIGHDEYPIVARAMKRALKLKHAKAKST